MVVTTNVLVLTGTRVPFVGAALGWWLIVVHPTYLVCDHRPSGTGCTGAERVAFSLGAVLLILVVGGLPLDLSSRWWEWPARSAGCRCCSGGRHRRRPCASGGTVGGSVGRSWAAAARILVPSSGWVLG